MKGRRRQSEQLSWDEPVDETQQEKAPSVFTMRRDARASTHTVASLASTVLTRASNIIQIAYIPGVTNRGGPTSPDLLVPPVPPIPAAVSPGTPRDNLHSHYFFAQDGRNSTYSGLGDAETRYGQARLSGMPSAERGSVASTVYRSNAVVGPQAQTIVRGKAAVVSVKSGGSGESSPYELENSPPIPTIPVCVQPGEHLAPSGVKQAHTNCPKGAPYEKYSGGTAVSTAQIGKPVPLNLTKTTSRSSLATTPAITSPNSAASDMATDYTASNNPNIHAALAAASSPKPVSGTTSSATAAKSPTPQLRLFPSQTPTAQIMNSPKVDAEDETSPFADSKTSDSPKKTQPGLRGVIEEAFRRGSNVESRLGQKSDGRSTSPFGDEHELNDDPK